MAVRLTKTRNTLQLFLASSETEINVLGFVSWFENKLVSRVIVLVHAGNQMAMHIKVFV